MASLSEATRAAILADPDMLAQLRALLAPAPTPAKQPRAPAPPSAQALADAYTAPVAKRPNLAVLAFRAGRIAVRFQHVADSMFVVCPNCGHKPWKWQTECPRMMSMLTQAGISRELAMVLNDQVQRTARAAPRAWTSS